ncbi:hypothetical protein BDF20DRAFT_915645 [Mycotypha africana]|uniref:uncharacterized protein n=1 Tax=Mycotypha africana TaxID=64632 RepID=UPI002300316C|nr:uncharacterized protein BDF20DRAFT_915645 [Mycotypha africana]KAI8971894.1 hypothetical protein BDF20DRAFT_915645 [Mycotypha africana]
MAAIALNRQFISHCRRHTIRYLSTSQALRNESVFSTKPTEIAATEATIKGKTSNDKGAAKDETVAARGKNHKEELLPDEKLQKKIAELELPLKSSRRSIGDSHSIMIDAIEAFRPRREVITEQQLEDTKKKLNKSFRVDQLRQYLSANKIEKIKSKTKAQVLDIILNQIWKIKTEEFLQREKQAILKDRLKKSIPASKQELFFIIGDQGNTIKSIENKHNVKITIDVDQSLYIIEGASQAVKAAEKETLSHKIIEEEMDLPFDLSDNTPLRAEIAYSLSDISKFAKTYVSFHPEFKNKVLLSSLEPESITNAKRLLNLMFTELDQNGKSSLNKSDHIIVKKPSDFVAVPFSDTRAMSFYDNAALWSRIIYNNKDINSSDENDIEEGYQFLNGQKIESFDHIKETLLKPFKSDNSATVSMEARFGHLLFNYDQQTYSPTSLKDIYSNSRNQFFNTMPPFSLVQSLLPFKNNFHERSIKVEYVDQSLLISPETQNIDRHLKLPGLTRLTIEFLINDDGQLKLKNIIGEKNRSVIDLLNVEGNIDVRLIAKASISYTTNNNITAPLEKLTNSCELTRTNELSAPLNFNFSAESKFVLSDITSILKKKFIYNTHAVHLNHIEHQDKKTKRTELIVNSIDPKSPTLSAINTWPSFSKAFTDLASRWTYFEELS